VLDSALAWATKALADRRRFELGPEQREAFMAALDAPPRDLTRLHRLMSEPSIFDPPDRE